MSFYEIEFPLTDLDSETAEDALSELGALSVTLVDGGDEPVLEPKPGEIRLWSDTRLRALFDESQDPTRVLAQLGARLGTAAAAATRLRRVADRAWERVWLEDWRPMRFGGRLWVCPSTAEAPAEANAVIVRLDPGLAFGTGSHPTTALCLQVIESLPLQDRAVLDYGCGSGILGIAALKLGAARVVAVDLDPQALTATRENARRNGVEAHIVVQGVSAPVPVCHLVVANILAGPLVELAPRLTLACEAGGHLVLSGLLRTQAHEVKAAYSSGFDMVRIIERQEWVLPVRTEIVVGVFTQCSNCQTVFKLSAEVLRAAGGQVRCGRCGEVFSALARLAEDASAFDSAEESMDLEQRADSILQTAVLAQVREAAPEESDELPPNFEVAHLEILDLSSDDEQAIVDQLRSEFPENESTPEEDLGDTSMEFTLPPGELDRIFIERKNGERPPFPLDDLPEPVSPNAFLPPQPVPRAAMSAFREGAPAEEAAIASLPADEPLETPGIEVIADHRRPAAGGVVAESVRRQVLEAAAPEYELDGTRPASRAHLGLWLAAAIVAALLLVGQIVHQHRQFLAEHGPFGEVLRSLYGSLGAPLAAPASLGAYQLRQWGVTGDPAADGTLKVRASILNTAGQLVPYPLLRVTLANRYGARIGARDFEPSEYLGKPTARLLSPGERVDATLSIIDPGKDAEGFEIDVCVRSNDKKIACANDTTTPQPKS